MTPWRIVLFGGFQLRHPAAPEEVKITATLQALLAYLLLFRHRAHSRDVIMELFWGDRDEAHARACLNTSLWRLRQILEPRGAVERGQYLLTNHVGDIGFNGGGDYSLDVADFETAVAPLLRRSAEALTDADAQQLEDGLRLYRGDLLEGIYADWALRERERLREMRLAALYHLLHHYRQRRRYDDALRCGQFILHGDPLREHVHRDLIQLYADSGRPAQAVQQYQTCRHALQVEMGIDPMPETRALYEQIAHATRDFSAQMADDGRRAAAASTGAAQSDDAYQTAQSLLTLCAEMQQRLGDLLHLLERQ